MIHKRFLLPGFAIFLILLFVFFSEPPSAQTQVSPTFTDNFSSTTKSPLWAWQDPAGGSKYSFTTNTSPTTFNLTVPRDHDQWINVDRAPRLLKQQPLAPYTIETRITANNGNSNTFGGIVIFKDVENWLLLGQLGNTSLEVSGILNRVYNSV